MHFEPRRVDVSVGPTVHRAELRGPGALPVGPVEVLLDVESGPAGVLRLAWSVANSSDRPLAVRSVAVVAEVVDAGEPLRLFRNGYQSWSPTGVATLGRDVDPSTLADFEFLQAVHHADQRRAADGELRSELVTVLAGPGGPPVVAGFDGGVEHDGTFRLRPGSGQPELAIEAFLGDAVLAPGERRSLHGVAAEPIDGEVSAALAAWARRVGSANGARTTAPYQVGWCSWYHYFHDITEDALRANLARAADWPFDVFQLDDGFQAGIGDWLDTNDRFPSSLDAIADAIAAAGRTPGIWLAPFLVAPDAQVLAAHPDWIARHGHSGQPLRAWWNPPWGGGDDGFLYALDTSNPEVLDHLAGVAAALVDAGFHYLKLDFTFAPAVDGMWADPSRTPAQRVRAGYDAIRRGAGDDTFLLGCGAPLGPIVGVVDGNRIGQDVAPLWDLDPADEIVRGYQGIEPSTQNAYGNTLTRAFLHRALWLNDPDCVMLRTTETALAPGAARTWARAVGLSGGMALVSDDLALLGDDARTLLDEVIALGRASDDATLAGVGPVVPDLLEHRLPTTISAAGRTLVVDPADGSSTLA